MVALYDALAQLAPSPVVELNRAVAVLHADGEEAALCAARCHPRRPPDGPLPPTARCAAMYCGGSASAEAAEELERAAGLAPTPHERRLLLHRAAAVNANS